MGVAGRPGLAYQRRSGQANSLGRFFLATNQGAAGVLPGVIYILGCQPKTYELGMGLSAPVERAIRRAGGAVKVWPGTCRSIDGLRNRLQRLSCAGPLLRRGIAGRGEGHHEAACPLVSPKDG